MASDLKLRSIKISDEMWDRWKAIGAQSGGGVTALIVQSVEELAVAIARATEAERRVAALESNEPADPGRLVIHLPPEVIKLVPGEDKVATVEAHLVERFGYGMHRLKQILKPEDKKGKRP